MAISVVSTGTDNAEGDSSGTTTVINFDAGFLADDLLIAVITPSQSSTAVSVTHTWPEGWTEIVDQSSKGVSGTGVGLCAAWHKAASDDEISSVTATAASTTGYVSRGIVLRGQDLTTPIVFGGSNNPGGNPTSIATPSVTTTQDNQFVVRIVAMDNDVSTPTSPSPSNYVLRTTIDGTGAGGDGGGDGSLGWWYDMVEPTTGATGTETISWTTAEEAVSATFAVAHAETVVNTDILVPTGPWR